VSRSLKSGEIAKSSKDIPDMCTFLYRNTVVIRPCIAIADFAPTIILNKLCYSLKNNRVLYTAVLVRLVSFIMLKHEEKSSTATTGMEKDTSGLKA